MDKLDRTKINAHFKKFTACLWKGLIHEWYHTLLAPPLPLILVNNSQLCSTHSHGWHPSLQHCSTNGKLRILVKAQPSNPSTWPLSPTRLCTQPYEYTLGHCGLSAASRYKLASTSRHYSLLTATWQWTIEDSQNWLFANRLRRWRVCQHGFPGLLTSKRTGYATTLTKHFLGEHAPRPFSVAQYTHTSNPNSMTMALLTTHQSLLSTLQCIWSG